jgi:hypothetical protein
MIPTDIDVTSLVIPFTVYTEVMAAASHTMLSVEELAITFNLSELVVRMYLRSTLVAVNLFWHGTGVNGYTEGSIHVSTPLGEETLGLYKTWGSFWQAAAEHNWIFREDFRRLNGPNLPNLESPGLAKKK